MSTDISELVEPWTSVRTEVVGGHTHVNYWVNHAGVGYLIMRHDEAAEAMRSICGREVACISAKAGGPILTIFHEPRTDCVVNDHGVVLSFRTLREQYRDVLFMSDEWKELNPDWDIFGQ